AVPPPKPEEKKAELAKTEEEKSEPAKTEEKKAEPAKTEEKKAEPAKTEEKKAEPAKTEEKKTEPAKSEEKKTEPAKTEEKKIEASTTEAEKTEAKKPSLLDSYKKAYTLINDMLPALTPPLVNKTDNANVPAIEANPFDKNVVLVRGTMTTVRLKSKDGKTASVTDVLAEVYLRQYAAKLAAGQKAVVEQAMAEVLIKPYESETAGKKTLVDPIAENIAIIEIVARYLSLYLAAVQPIEKATWADMIVTELNRLAEPHVVQVATKLKGILIKKYGAKGLLVTRLDKNLREIAEAAAQKIAAEKKAAEATTTTTTAPPEAKPVEKKAAAPKIEEKKAETPATDVKTSDVAKAVDAGTTAASAAPAAASIPNKPKDFDITVTSQPGHQPLIDLDASKVTAVKFIEGGKVIQFAKGPNTGEDVTFDFANEGGKLRITGIPALYSTVDKVLKLQVIMGDEVKYVWVKFTASAAPAPTADTKTEEKKPAAEKAADAGTTAASAAPAEAPKSEEKKAAALIPDKPKDFGIKVYPQPGHQPLIDLDASKVTAVKFIEGGKVIQFAKGPKTGEDVTFDFANEGGKLRITGIPALYSTVDKVLKLQVIMGDEVKYVWVKFTAPAATAPKTDTKKDADEDKGKGKKTFEP
ncbi:MAG: hypothetical protein HQM16_00605, partial [Deltaproteobacteria bacterium]|nr:hypothetical protein [Deltaproteobacteria bacterium]